MPEGPEVKRLVCFLETFSGKTLSEVEILSGRYRKHGPFEGYSSLVKKLPSKIKTVSCKGKFIYFSFFDGTSLWCTLGMSGTWLKSQRKHSRVRFRVDNTDVWFDDVRNFGTLKFANSPDELKKKLSTLGHDPLVEDIDCIKLNRLVSRKTHKTISEILMDQKVFAGVGNYLKSEILYASKVSPHRTYETLTRDEVSSICYNTNRIMKLSFDSGGATILTYRDENGDPGSFSRRFAVYGQKEDPLGNCVIKETTRDRRTTHWVPGIQV